jgi:hypothetical protein
VFGNARKGQEEEVANERSGGATTGTSHRISAHSKSQEQIRFCPHKAESFHVKKDTNFFLPLQNTDSPQKQKELPLDRSTTPRRPIIGHLQCPRRAMGFDEDEQ